MFVNIIKSHRDIVAICDSDLLGKRFEEGKYQLDVKENFYKGEEQTSAEVLEIIKDMAREDATFNIAGEESIAAAIEVGIITPAGVRKINGVPFALVLA